MSFYCDHELDQDLSWENVNFLGILSHKYALCKKCGELVEILNTKTL